SKCATCTFFLLAVATLLALEDADMLRSVAGACPGTITSPLQISALPLNSVHGAQAAPFRHDTVAGKGAAAA
ncbi:MAG TPA: hypothetical protein VE224_01565, partial [Pseudolabrys sp.]|nr:hypothetical protein [Pseudolabrys sp.]